MKILYLCMLQLWKQTVNYLLFHYSVVLARTKEYCSVFHAKIRVSGIFYFLAEIIGVSF